MKRTRWITACLLPLLAIAARATTYYVANAGSDTANGTSPSTPWQTIAKLNTIMPNLQPGDSVLLHRGDVFRDDYIRCMNQVNDTASTTSATNPLACSGSVSAQITIGSYGDGTKPIIDGADILSLTWTLVQGTTWQATYTGAMPTKLYVDSPTMERQQILPMPNYVGTYVYGTVYNFLDSVSYTTNASVTKYLIHGSSASVADTSATGTSSSTPCPSGCPTDATPVWTNLSGATSSNGTQSFNLTNTGLQNVEAGITAPTTVQLGFGAPKDYPGVWYVTGSTIYLNLTDGTNPNSHIVSGTRRPYGVLLSSVDYVTVQDLAVEHTQKSGIESVAYSNTGTNSAASMSSYFTNEYNVIQRNHIWNTGDLVLDAYPLQSHTSKAEAGIVVVADGQYYPHLLRGDQIFNNKIGIVDSYFGMYGGPGQFQAGIFEAGIDGGGTANNLVIAGNYVATRNARGIVYSNANLSWSATIVPTYNNSGGRISNNELTNNQGNLYFTSVDGGQLDHNFVHESYGEGFQIGGASTSVSTGGSVPVAGSQVITLNVLAHVAQMANTSDFNIIDCNSNSPGTDGVYYLSNTFVDGAAALLTFENLATNATANPTYGCTRPHVHNNILSQNHLQFPLYSSQNVGNVYYYTAAQYNYGGFDFSNNYYTLSSGQSVLARSGTGGTSFQPSTFLAGFPDTNSVIGTDPGFSNYAGLDFSLSATSPARGAGTLGSDLGSTPYVAKSFANASFGGRRR